MRIDQKNIKGKPLLTNNGLRDTEWLRHTKAGVNWLRKSIEATGGRGSAHSWHPLLGWSKSYPETTGYIIPTLLDYAVLHQDDTLKILANGCANWLTTIQLPSGAFPGLLLGNKAPSIFNTSQILFGLCRVSLADESNLPVKEALVRAASWLVSMLEPDYSWKRHAFVPGYTPSYYTRAIWGLLYANNILQDPDLQENMHKALWYYAQRFLMDAQMNDWGFRPGEPAFTHTIAYTLEGFLECALIFEDADILTKVIAIADQLIAVRLAVGGRTAGRYGQAWKGDYSFVCNAGNAQLCVFFRRLYEVTGAEKYQILSHDFLKEVMVTQKLNGNRNRIGAISGSTPIWGAYLPFRYPNWGLKFFLDAMNS